MELKIVVIGGSAGSLSAVIDIARSIPSDLNAAIFVVLHTVPRERTLIPEILNRLRNLPAQQAEEGTRIRASEIYVAPLTATCSLPTDIYSSLEVPKRV